MSRPQSPDRGDVHLYVRDVNTLNPYEPTAQNGRQLQRIARLAVGSVLLITLVATTVTDGIAWVQFAGMFGGAFVALLPLAIAVMIHQPLWSNRIGHTITAAGFVMVLHVTLTAATVELLLRQPFVLDLVPYGGVISLTLNIAVPGSLLGLAFAMLTPSLHRTRQFWIGGLVLVVGNVVAIGYGYYFFDALLGDDLASNVWWI